MEFLKEAELFDLAQNLFCIIGNDGYLKKSNNSFLELVGYTEEELLAKPFSDFLHEEDHTNFINFYTAYHPKLSNNILENRIKCSDGSFKWFSWNSITHENQSCIYVYLRDISAQKELEQRLRNSLSAHQKTLDCSLDLICSIDIEGRFITVSKASENLLGYTPEEMTLKPAGNFLHPADAEITSQMAIDLINGAEYTNFENRYIHKNGHTVPVVWSAKFSHEDQIFYCVARNATERKKQEELIRFNENRFKGLVQSGADVIAILDHKGVHQYISPTISTVLGYNPDALLGKSLFDLVHPDNHDLISTSIKRVLQQYRVELPLYKIKNASGEWRWMKTIVTNLMDDVSISGIVANSRDITEQILIENEKENAIKRLNNVIENYTQGYLNLDKDWVVRGVNPATLRLLGATEEMLLNKSITDLFPNHESPFYEQYKIAIKENRFVEFEEKMFSTNRWFLISAYPYENSLTVFFKETTHEKLQQLLVNLEKEVLELNIISGKALSVTVERYLEGLNKIYNLQCLLCLYNRQKSLLIPFSAPNFPKEYVEAHAKGFPATTDYGACGSAGFTKQSFIVSDIINHPVYKPYKEILLKNNLRSCWAHPMVSSKDELIGTLAIYHGAVREPDDNERELIKRVSAFLQTLIESHQVKDNLAISNERYKFITHATSDATYDWNMDDEYLYWGEGAGKLFGYSELKSKITDWGNRIHIDERDRVNESLEKALENPLVNYWHEEYKYERADGTFAFVLDDGYILRNENNVPIRMVGAMKDLTKLKEDATQILLQNTRLQEIATINSHQIRKPLANVLGIINAIKAAEPTEVNELLALLDESGQELDSIVRMIALKTLV
ncbi:MAG TPA: PAS domain S-box protein [Pedobacter sp.]|jgi:PAS domain S-box-containing protein